MPKDACDSCGVSAASVGKLFACGQCLNSWYCGRDHQIGSWPSHRPFCIPRGEKDGICLYAKTELASRDAYFADSKEDQWALKESKARLQAFIRANPWPAKADVLDYIEKGTDHRFDLSDTRLYNHDLARRLYEAGVLEPQAECEEQRMAGFLLERLGGMEAMQYQFYIVQHMLCGSKIWPDKGELRGQDVSEFVKCLELAWDKIGSWWV